MFRYCGREGVRTQKKYYKREISEEQINLILKLVKHFGKDFEYVSFIINRKYNKKIQPHMCRVLSILKPISNCTRGTHPT